MPVSLLILCSSLSPFVPGTRRGGAELIGSSAEDQIETGRSPGPGYGAPVLDGLGYDDSEPPSIGLVPPGTSWQEVHDHIKISHNFLLVETEPGGEDAGAELIRC